MFKQGEQIFLDFPTDEPVEVNPNSRDGSLIEQIIGAEPVGVLKGRDDFMVVVESEEQVLSVVPDMILLEDLPSRGLIVTSMGKERAISCLGASFPSLGRIRSRARRTR